MTEPFNLAAWREHVLTTTRSNQPMTPTGEWTGVFLIDNGADMVIMPTQPYRSTPAVWRKAVTVWLPSLVVEKGGRAYALVNPIWESNNPLTAYAGPAADPRRRESVSVQIGARLGQEIVHEAWFASVARRENQPPHLGPWREIHQAEGHGVGPLQAALQYLARHE